MLFRSKDLKAIVAGARTLAFRRWKRPTVKVGSTVRTHMGLVGIDAIEAIDPATLSELEAREAGYPGLHELVAMFDAREGTCYRIRLHYAGPDVPDGLADKAVLTPDERATIDVKLARLDAHSEIGPWTATTLRLIADYPGLVARELSKLAGRERDSFKRDVRKLKALGLTISLEVGYRISPRGEAYLRR